MKAPVICIDGPAASGKTTIARLLADRLGFFYLDTGVLYRAVTWAALMRGIASSDAEGLGRLARDLSIEVKAAPLDDPRQTVVLVDGEDVSLAIRGQAVDGSVSEVSAHMEVRTALIDLQRSIAAGGGVILAGRDAGTVVWPQAEVKVYLTASKEERACRRVNQAEEQGVHLDLAAVLADLVRRDEHDSSRAVAPLRAAPDAVTVDTTAMSIDQVVQRLLEILCEKTGVCVQ